MKMHNLSNSNLSTVDILPQLRIKYRQSLSVPIKKGNDMVCLFSVDLTPLPPLHNLEMNSVYGEGE